MNDEGNNNKNEENRRGRSGSLSGEIEEANDGPTDEKNVKIAKSVRKATERGPDQDLEVGERRKSEANVNVVDLVRVEENVVDRVPKIVRDVVEDVLVLVQRPEIDQTPEVVVVVNVPQVNQNLEIVQNQEVENRAAEKQEDEIVLPHVHTIPETDLVPILVKRAKVKYLVSVTVGTVLSVQPLLQTTEVMCIFIVVL
eukprot:UN24436